jgi:molybdenum cofactor synthesis domain-containing protein
MRVAVITVGDEILAGDITDTNASWLAASLTERGVTVGRMATVPDEREAIAGTVAELAAAFDAVVVTGGLGPTHDDLTLEGVAAAFDRPVVDDEKVRAYLDSEGYRDYAERGESATRFPEGARLLENEVGVAPGAVVENVYVLPGVPAEMQAMFESVAGEFDGELEHTEFVAADEPESRLVERFEAVRERFDVKIGSYPGDGVRIKVRGADPEEVTAASEWLRERVDQR